MLLVFGWDCLGDVLLLLLLVEVVECICVVYVEVYECFIGLFFFVGWGDY